MRGVDTSADRPAPLAVRVVELTRRQLLILALLACVPLPLLSIATTAAPLPEIVQRAAAGLVPFSPADREVANVRASVAPRSLGTPRRTPAKGSTAPAGVSRTSSPSTQKAATGTTRAHSAPKHPGHAALSVGVAPARSGADTTTGTAKPNKPTKPTKPDASDPPARVTDPSPSAGASDAKKSKGNGGDKISTGATKAKNETGNGGKAGESKAVGVDGGNGQKTGQDASGGNQGGKSKP